MTTIRFRLFFLLCVFAPGILAESEGQKVADHPQREGAVLFQVSTLDALLQGIYNGSYTVGQLKQQGDFGLGAYQGIDGEMIVLNGHYYHMRANGVVSEAA